MATFRVTWFWAQAQYGWSETWWRVANDIKGMIAPIQDYTNARAALLAANQSLIGVRIAIEGAPRTGLVVLPGDTNFGDPKVQITLPKSGSRPFSLAATSTKNPDQVRACLQCLVEAGGQKFGIRYLVGIPDGMTTTEPAGFSRAGDPTWPADFDAYALLIQNQWLVKAQVRDGDGAAHTVARWLKQTTGDLLIGAQLSQADSIATGIGKTVVVTAARTNGPTIRSPNGTWIVDSLVAGDTQVGQTIYLRGSGPVDPTKLVRLGSIRKQIFQFLKVDLFRGFDVGIHKRGKIFRQRLGRVKTRKYTG